MRYFILNIGLMDGECPDFQYQKEYVELAVNTAFKDYGEPCIRYTNEGTEPTAIVTVGVPNGTPRATVNWCVRRISKMMNQDCIAVWDCQEGTGTLQGHNQEREMKWGEFDANYFRI